MNTSHSHIGSSKSDHNIRWVQVEWGQLMSAFPKSDVASRLSEWYESFPADDVRSRIVELEKEMQERAAEIRFLSERLGEWEKFQGVLSGSLASSTSMTPVSENGQYPHKREAVLKVLGAEPLRTFKLEEIRQEMVDRGWLPDDDAGTHALQVYISNMAKRNEVERPRKGFYRYKLPTFQAMTLGVGQD